MDIMQNSRDEDDRASRFLEGRLRLSTSCLECHRRKQRCDQQQPCNQCARRFPHVECIYRSRSATREPSTGLRRLSDAPPKSEQSMAGPSGPALPLVADLIGYNAESSTTVQDSGLPILDLGLFTNFGCQAETSLSIETLHLFNPSTFQQLVSTMVSRMCGELPDDTGLVVQFREQRQPPHAIPRCQRCIASTAARAVQAAPGSNDGHLGVIPTPGRFTIDPLHFLGITPTAQSSELLQAFVTLISKYVVSIDGNPTPGNYYNDYWVGWAMKSPLLTSLGIFTAACYQAEVQKTVPGHSTLVLSYKVECIRLLNEMLACKETATCNEAITAVVYLIVNDWYWSNWNWVQAHMKGLKEMVRLRGGIDELGMEGFPRKLILLTDYHIACSYNCEQYFKHDTTPPLAYPSFMSTPFVPSSTEFESVAEELQISQNTAIVLREMRFLITKVINQIDNEPSEKEKIKLKGTSAFTQNLISSLPDESEFDEPSAIDFVFKTCRIAALIYCKAIINRISLAKACTLIDLNNLWANMWHVKLSRWKQIPGIFLFVILSAIPACQATPHGRFLKSIFKATSSYISLEYWDVVDGTLMSFVKLQRWLKNGTVEVVGSTNPPPMEFFHIYDR